MPRLVLATHNKKKLLEIERIVGPLLPSLEVLTLDDFEAYDEPVESELTFAGNALLKARAAVARTGLPALADDSGLAVDALNGMPGVLSARWAGKPKSDERNNALLLEQIEDVPDEFRAAAFVSAVAFVLPSGEEQVVEGRVPGVILRAGRGEGGFGYDPLFLPDGVDQTMAELTAEEKDELSHRGRALRAVAPLVAAVL
ncbi:RdgB/HAM1 family non-canonical purine NTP pyrophosphatase [Tenggerimyces flavus]|uniref:dITP/XTP pyrophosphatase n=1 Tax=Tenggerimyces flavus TaxID=1708749 RepID=A0ABV7YR86_9ACTN|nr:RdgB/HAM1 family non-canonical purine NTP pyrophosphatase [Tenggerimyces flavus]MBM7786388.1 XTP/dITP diphosphohydrolase [Tenggerimyces flavus]